MNFQEQCDKLDSQTAKIKARYRRLGWVKNEKEEQELHQAFSPFRVPAGLTRLQVRRKIGHFRREGNPSAMEVLFGNSIQVIINGKQVIRGTFGGNAPTTRSGLHKVLRDLVEFNGCAK